MKQFLAAVLVCGMILLPRVQAQDAGIDFFEKRIRPALVEHCYSCHSQESKKQRGGLRLDSREAVRKGGASGPAIVPGNPEHSLLLKALRYQDDDLKMPPKGKLPANIIADFEHWVALGAADPRDGARAAAREIDLEEGRKFWCFQPPRQRPLPAVKDQAWPRGPIDRFILARLEEMQLTPAPDADRATLLRRLYFALIGLPPAPEEIDAFVHDSSPAALARVIDRLLASPQFGERWGRHWLDVARFAESSGGGRSLLFREAWRYRDYVIHAFNTGKPFDRFIMEQIAGDLLPAGSDEDRYWQIVALAFLMLGPTNYERQDKPILEMDVIDEQLDTIGKGFLGMTVGCARCHDHKFDPIPSRDYYALAGVLKSTKMLIHENVSRWVEVPLPVIPGQEREWKGQKRPRRPMAMAVQDGDAIDDCHLCIRGNVHNKGERVRRGFLQVATLGPMPVVSNKESGRRQLAAWLASPENPLTARVMVNRIWHHLFGAGLVRTVDNFGSTGDRPSHPELLDYLAGRFVEQGWSVKKLIREIVLSRTYQLASAGARRGVSPTCEGRLVQADPENRLLGRANRRRLEAECVRDTILLLAGNLDRSVGGPTIKQGTAIERDYQFTDARRSVYTPIFRNRLLELFEVFDFADPNLLMGRRNVSTVPTQALYLMNSPFVMAQAKAAAERTLASPGLDARGRIDRAFRLALGRLPSVGERRLLLEFLAESDHVGLTPRRSPQPGERRGVSPTWERFYQALFACLDFRYVN